MTRYKTLVRGVIGSCLCLVSIWVVSECAREQQPERGITWLPMCEDLPAGGLDSEVVARTQCGIVTVPLDHLNPDLGSLQLEITRVTARQPQAREGAIFTNPGGPGSNGNDTFTVLLASVWKGYIDKPEGEPYRHLTNAYDLIGITPRGQSRARDSQLRCQSEELIVTQGDISEDRSPTNLAALHHNIGVLARGCASQRLAPYINTEQTARDMEFVRIELNENKLHYFGNSYGTWLGAWYAGLFPKQVGRMMLDSNMDWTSTFQNASLSIAPQKERIFNHFVAEHAANNPQTYRLGSTPKDVREVFLNLLPAVRTALRSDSQYYSSPEHLMAAQTLSDWLNIMPDADEAELEMRAQAHRFSPDEEVDHFARQAFNDVLFITRQPVLWNGLAPGKLNLSAADSVRSTVLCNDSPSANAAFWQRKEDIYATKYPIAGNFFLARHCAEWKGGHPPAAPFRNVAQADSIVMVQAEFDDQTPRAEAFNAFARFSNTHMVLLKGAYGHGVSFADLSACVNRYVGEYLAYGRKPERLTLCEPDD
ncbi:Pimeloyl-ACP methyl ester carboxylesterase [Pseudomonas lini]|uniref:Pimeloyl-ACP methyl ester carboxylesterase n=2 Tax=Pseudomonas lini TaxID=163011 RepID=A0A1H1ZQ96_9PSED|nr:Pimeloyl-ACP methyl ester carboxylesterase [Pseudomonas lini]